MNGKGRATRAIAGLLVAAATVGPATAGPDDPVPKIVAGPLAGVADYATQTTASPAGSKVLFANGDLLDRHDVVSRRKDDDGKPLFRSAFIAGGQITEVIGAHRLAKDEYDFFCSVHPAMSGTLVII